MAGRRSAAVRVRRTPRARRGPASNAASSWSKLSVPRSRIPPARTRRVAELHLEVAARQSKRLSHADQQRLRRPTPSCTGTRSETFARRLVLRLGPRDPLHGHAARIQHTAQKAEGTPRCEYRLPEPAKIGWITSAVMTLETASLRQHQKIAPIWSILQMCVRSGRARCN